MISPILMEQLKGVGHEVDIPADFKCLGTIDKVYPSLSPDILDRYYRTWIWVNSEGIRIATWDEGNCWCHFICEGTVEAIMDFINIPQLIEE